MPATQVDRGSAVAPGVRPTDAPMVVVAGRRGSQILNLMNRASPRFGRCRAGLSWGELKRRCRFPVKDSDFPQNVPAGYPARHPCSDGATIWVPEEIPTPLKISYFLHELAHCELHYPSGPNPDLEDPILARVRDTGDQGLLLQSIMEAEACAAAFLAAKALQLPDPHNQAYLSIWNGDVEAFERESLAHVEGAAQAIIDRYKP